MLCNCTIWKKNSVGAFRWGGYINFHKILLLIMSQNLRWSSPTLLFGILLETSFPQSKKTLIAINRLWHTNTARQVVQCLFKIGNELNARVFFLTLGENWFLAKHQNQSRWQSPNRGGKGSGKAHSGRRLLLSIKNLNILKKALKSVILFTKFWVHCTTYNL